MAERDKRAGLNLRRAPATRSEEFAHAPTADETREYRPVRVADADETREYRPGPADETTVYRPDEVDMAERQQAIRQRLQELTRFASIAPREVAGTATGTASADASGVAPTAPRPPVSARPSAHPDHRGQLAPVASAQAAAVTAAPGQNAVLRSRWAFCLGALFLALPAALLLEVPAAPPKRPAPRVDEPAAEIPPAAAVSSTTAAKGEVLPPVAVSAPRGVHEAGGPWTSQPGATDSKGVVPGSNPALRTTTAGSAR